MTCNCKACGGCAERPKISVNGVKLVVVFEEENSLHCINPETGIQGIVFDFEVDKKATVEENAN